MAKGASGEPPVEWGPSPLAQGEAPQERGVSIKREERMKRSWPLPRKKEHPLKGSAA